MPPFSSTPSESEDSSALAKLHQAEIEVEARVGAAFIRAEQSLVRRFGVGCLRGLRLAVRGFLIALLLAYFAFGAAFLAVRHMVLPNIDEYRPQIETLARDVLDAQVHIGRIEADWHGFHPNLKLTDVRLNRRRASEAAAPLSERADALVLPQIDATLSWSSVWRLTPRFRDLSVLAPHLEVRRLNDGRWLIGGFVLDPSAATHTDADTRALDWVLGQRRITIRDAQVLFIDETLRNTAGEPRQVELQEVEIRAEGGWHSNRFAVRATPPSELSAPLDVRAEIEHPLFEPASRVALWSGRVFAQADFVDLAQLKSLMRWLPGAVRLDAAQGALRTWVDFDQQRARRVVADLALAHVDVQLAPDLVPLALDSLRGRLAYREFDSVLEKGQELTLDNFAMTGRAVELENTASEEEEANAASKEKIARSMTSAVAVPPTRLRLRLTPASATQKARGEFEASLVLLDQLSALAAHVPLARELRAVVARHAVGGALTQLSGQWEGGFVFDAEAQALRQLPAHYSVKTNFSKLSSVAVPAEPPLDSQGRARLGLPGFQNLAGALELNEVGGSAQIDSTQATLEFPGLFEDPRKLFNTLSGAVQWQQPRGDAPLEVKITRLAAANEAVNFTIDGLYRSTVKGAGYVDLNGRIDTAVAQHAHEYLPLSVGPGVRHWLRDALLSGSAGAGTLRLRGNLADFPYAHGKDGEFRVSARLREGALDFAPHLHRADGSGANADTPRWPVLRDIDADLLFERNLMRISARQAQAEDVALTQVTAEIDGLGAADAQLHVNGNLRGPLARMLETVAHSPVGPMLGNVLAQANAKGEAQGELKLDIPLTAASTHVTVRGAVNLKDNELALRMLPPFTQAHGRIEFSDRSLQMNNVQANFLGGAVQINAETQLDGSLVFKATGSTTPTGLRPLLDAAAVQAVLDRSNGNARYNAAVIVRGGHTDIRVESDLVGWGLDLPFPLGKLAATPLPLRVLLTPSFSNEQDRLQINAGSVLSMRLEREINAAERSARVLRGTVRITDEPSTEPIVMPADGVRVDVALTRLDLDRWISMLPSPSTAPSTAARGDDGALPNLISARVRELRVAGKPIANVVLGASRHRSGPQNGVWQINVESDQASGALLIQPAEAGQDARVNARLARLTIPESQRAEIAELLDAPLNDMPALDVVAENFELGKRKLGRLELVAQNTVRNADNVNARDWQLQKLEITNPDGKFAATGKWVSRTADAAHRSASNVTTSRRMELNFDLDFSDGGGLLTRFGIAEALRATSGTLEGQVSWRGSPFSLDFPSLNGQVKLNAEKGQFLKADAGVGRLLGVMSLQSLPRRLSLDFRDIFSEGFAFDSIRASADIQNGVLNTRDMRMRGVPATVLMEGGADLARETQNLHVLVLPDINAGSASLLYAALANPAIGIGTFLAQMFLRDPLSKAFSFEYDITGSWADPVVKRRVKPQAETSEPSP